MKIEHLAVIFVLIILPIDIVLGLYLDAQMNTIRNQAMYDSKLVDCVYDAMKVYQSNSIADTENDIITTKMENIEASANTFLSSLQTSFGLSGYKASVMQEYVPAVVYTMYDGYYIYSKFNNTLSQKQIKNFDNTFKDGKMYEGIKSYVFYSCRYRRENSDHTVDDFVVTYSLDNYITIQGKIHSEYVYDSGYLVDGIEKKEKYDGFSDYYKYDDVYFYSNESAINTEYIDQTEYKYTKINGTKYYWDEGNKVIFHLVNGVRREQANELNTEYNKYVKAIEKNLDAYLYYKEAYEFTNRVRSTFATHPETQSDGSIKTIVDSYGLYDLTSAFAGYSDKNGNFKYFKDTEDNWGNYTIFGKDKNKLDNTTGTDGIHYIQDSDSAFNQHRKEVIRYTIETNLKAAIAGFSGLSSQSIEYAMPKISEEDWETVENNVSVIGFLQGLDIGTKKYNGYAVVANTLTSEFVDENSIYLITTDNQYHRANAKDITTLKGGTNAYSYNLDFEKHYIKNGDNNLYYYPQGYKTGSTVNPYTGSYTSIVSQTSVDTEYEDMYKYMRNKAIFAIKQNFYYGLARERYGSYKISHDTKFDYYLKNYR